MSASQSFPSTAAVLGSGVVVKGTIHSGEPLIIEGEVEGSIEMLGQKLTIAGSAQVRANVTARELKVHGRFDGQAETSERIHLARTAEFTGDIYAGSLVIEDGAYVKGRVELASRDGKTK